MSLPLSDFQKDRLLHQFGRQAARKENDSYLLVRLLLDHPQELGPRSLAVAIESGRAVAAAIEEALDERHGPRADELARHLEPHLPWPTVSLREVADKVATRHVNSTALHEPAPVLSRAGRLINLAVRQLDMGKLAESLATGRQAMALLQSEGEGEVDALHVITAVSNVLVTLIALGNYVEASRVATHACELLDGIPEDARAADYDVHRARIVSSGALAHFHTGRFDTVLADTEWAIRVFREQLEAGQGSFRVELSRTLSNLSMFLSHLGRPREVYRTSAEAVRVAREAVERNADGSLPELALALEGLASRSRAIGRRKRAAVASMAALDIYERLTLDSLLSHGRHFATCLNNHAIYLVEAAIEGDRMGLALRAVAILEDMHRAHPNSVDEELAMAYSTYAGAILALGPDKTPEQADDAVTTLNNAVITIQRCRSLGSRLRLAALLSNLSEASREIERPDEAERARSLAAQVLDSLSAEELASIPGVADAVRSRL